MATSKNLASVKMYGSPDVKPKIDVPEATITHFYNAGRILTYFPNVNLNGYTFEKDRTEGLADTLLASITDVQHVKAGYGVTDPLVGKEHNAVIGAINKVLAHDDGIDICVKIERGVAMNLGFSPKDFEPTTGLLGNYSQECDFDKTAAEYIVVDKSDPSKIVKRIPYADGQAIGLNISSFKNGKWDYVLVEGNPVYMSITPTSFAGVGHVARPADPSAEVYRLASARLNADFPGMDSENLPAADMARPFMTAEYNGNDLTQYTQDFVVHPDLLSSMDDAKIDKLHNKGDDAEAPDDHYAACYSTSDYANLKDGEPKISKTRMYRIKSAKGEYDRSHLIAAYHAIMGLRGDISAQNKLPFNVRQHALARVRQGLNETKPKITKENSSLHMETPNEIEALNTRITELAKAKNLSPADIMTMISNVETLTSSVAEKDTALAAKDATITELNTKIETLTSTLKGIEDNTKSTERFAALDKALAFTDDEKKAETFPEFVKNLAGLTDTDFKVELLERALAAAKAPKPEVPDRILSAASPTTNPVPHWQDATGKSAPLTGADLF